MNTTQASSWLVNEYAPAWLRLAGLDAHANALNIQTVQTVWLEIIAIGKREVFDSLNRRNFAQWMAMKGISNAIDQCVLDPFKEIHNRASAEQPRLAKETWQIAGNAAAMVGMREVMAAKTEGRDCDRMCAEQVAVEAFAPVAMTLLEGLEQ